MIEDLILPNGKLRISNDQQYSGMYSAFRKLGWEDDAIKQWIETNVHFMYGGALLPQTVVGNGNVTVSGAVGSSITINGRTYS